MRLTLACHPITEIRLETPTRLDGTVLVVDPEELRQLVLEDDSLTADFRRLSQMLNRKQQSAKRIASLRIWDH